jgi:hypothetical protein
MAETGRGKKFVKVAAYVKRDGTHVPAHDRSTPRTSKGAQANPPKRRSAKR